MVDKRNFRENPVTSEELTNCYWYAVPNDLIGGTDVSNVNKPESQRNPYKGEFEIGTFMSKQVAEHIAKIHNTWWDTEVWKTYSSNIYHTYKRDVDAATQDVMTKFKSVFDSLRGL